MHHWYWQKNDSLRWVFPGCLASFVRVCFCEGQLNGEIATHSQDASSSVSNIQCELRSKADPVLFKSTWSLIRPAMKLHCHSAVGHTLPLRRNVQVIAIILWYDDDDRIYMYFSSKMGVLKVLLFVHRCGRSLWWSEIFWNKLKLGNF